MNGTPSSYGVEVVGGLQLLLGPQPVDVQPADRREQVGAERQVGALAAAQHEQHLGERLGHQVVGLGAAGQLHGQAAGGAHVTGEQGPVGGAVAGAHAGDQLAVPPERQVVARIGPGFAHQESKTHFSGKGDVGFRTYPAICPRNSSSEVAS